MPKMIFVNLPVGDLNRAIAFYQAVGGQLNKQFTDQTAACMVFSETINVMLLTHEKFREFTPKSIADARTASEVLLCLTADNRKDVDDIVAKAGTAGGRIDPGLNMDHGFMYGRSFEDLDGHIWEIMWMDIDAAKNAMTAD